MSQSPSEGEARAVSAISAAARQEVAWAACTAAVQNSVNERWDEAWERVAAVLRVAELVLRHAEYLARGAERRCEEARQ